jgi:predicted DNA-binding transcriptional regulator YafY
MCRVWVRGVVSREELISLGLRTRRDRGGTLSRRTIERDLNWLVREGILEESGEDADQTYYRLGPRIASDSGLSCEELARLLGYLEVRMQTSPHRTFLRSAYARIDWNSALRRDRSMYDKLVSMVEAQSEYCIIQGRLPQMDVQETKLLRDVETAIRERRKLSFVYEPRRRQSMVRWEPPDTPGGLEPGPDPAANDNGNGNAPANADAGADAGEPEIVSPLGIIYYWVLDAWYLVSVADSESRWMRRALPLPSCGEGPHRNLQLWRLDRIKSLSVTDIPFTYPQDFDLHALFADRWGLQGGDRMHVRVRFYNDFNVVSRMRAETAHRRNRVLREEPDGTWIYEDDIVGFDDFRMWLRSFGASAEVLGPERLRAAMRESALKMLERYSAPGGAGAGRSEADEAGAGG